MRFIVENACSNSSLSQLLHHSKGTENEISSNNQPVQLSSVVISCCLSTNHSKDDRTFRASTSIIICERERTFYAISVVDLTMTDILKTQNPLQVCKAAKRSFVDAPYMV